MSSRWWANQLGTAAVATTPSGSIPQYGLAYDVGTAPWDAASFQAWSTDETQRNLGPEVAAAEAAVREEDESYFNQFFGAVGSFIGNAFGSIQRSGQQLAGVDVPDDPELDRVEENQALAGQGLENITSTPGVSQMMTVMNAGYAGVTTPLIMDRNTQMSGNFSNWFSPTAWARAYRAADERSFGEAFVEAVITGSDTTHDDLERVRRTNSLYGLSSLAVDLYAGFKADPTVLLAKGIGEARAVRAGDLPRGQTSQTARREAQTVAQAETPEDAMAYRYRGFNPAGHYGAWRGKRIVQSFDDVWKAAEELDFIDFQDLPMFRRKATNGAPAARAMQLAARDPKLRDLTRRAVMADPAAWQEIRRLQLTTPDELREYAPGAKTFLDAIEATKTKQAQLQQEVEDLEKLVAVRDATVPMTKADGGMSPGFFNHYTWELHRDSLAKKADLDKLDHELAAYEDYGRWLRNIDSSGDRGRPNLEGASAVPGAKSLLSRKTYHDGPYSKTHQVLGRKNMFMVREAGPFHLGRVDEGVTTIRRMFEQYDFVLGYRDRSALDDVLVRYTDAPDEVTRRDIVREVELSHGRQALAQKTGLSLDLIDDFLKDARTRTDDMFDRLVAGTDSVYTTVPDGRGGVNVNVVENGQKVTHNLPVDPTQLPNYYTPMDIRRTYLLMKRHADLFSELESAYRNGFRDVTGRTMNSIDFVGTKFNQVWKPFQLFRLAWPQRVLLDESFRMMAVLGATGWAKQTLPAALHASRNAVLAHGPLPWAARFFERRRVNIGPGPLADEVTGNKVADVPAREAEVEAAPFAPASFSPTVTDKRGTQMADIVATLQAERRYEQKRQALMRNPNPVQSLPHNEFGDGAPPEVPSDWVEIDAILPEGIYDNFDGEDFSLADIIGAQTPLTDNELMVALGGRDRDGDVFTIFDLLARRPESIRKILNADANDPDLEPGGRVVITAGTAKKTAASRWGSNIEIEMAKQYGKGGPKREALRDLARREKKRFADEIRHRNSGAGRAPLFSGIFNDLTSEYAITDMLRAKALGGKYVPTRWGASSVPSLATKFPARPRSYPLGNAFGGFLRRANETLAYNARTGTSPTGTVRETFDPINGKPVKSGYAVPVLTEEIPLADLPDFVERHQSLLAANGYRITFTVREATNGRSNPRVEASVVRHFRRNELPKAVQFGAWSNTDEFYNVEKGHSEFILDRNDQSPISEQLDRAFYAGKEWREQKVNAPAVNEDGSQVPTVAHGTQHDDGLPEQLLPRQDVPVANGNYYGPGFYTSVDLEYVASSGFAGYGQHGLTAGTPEWFEYMSKHVYTITGTRSGKKYKTFNLQKPITDADKEILNRRFSQWADELEELPTGGLTNYERQVLTQLINDGSSPLGDVITWADLYDALEGNNFTVGMGRVSGYSGDPREMRRYDAHEELAKIMEEEYDAGALFAPHFNLGRTHGVYIWLHPEDLRIKPLYMSDGKTYLLEDWFNDPRSVENMVPQNRIHRTGKRNPLLRELETIHNRREALDGEVTAGRADDTGLFPLLDQEQRIMRTLGLEYTHNLPGYNDRHGTDIKPSTTWYTQVRDPEAERAAQQADNERGDRLRETEQYETGGIFDDVDLFAFDQEIDSVQDRFIRRLTRRKQFGAGKVTVKDRDGKRLTVQDINEEDTMVSLVSASPAYARLTDTYMRTLNAYRTKAIGHKVIQPPDSSPEALRTRAGRDANRNYLTRWADLINDQIRNSPIWYRMLHGESDEQILTWLNDSHEGKVLRNKLPHKGYDPERWVEEHRQALEFYIPDAGYRALARDRRIDPSDLRRMQGDRPAIYGPDLEMIDGSNGWGQKMGSLVEKIYHVLGTVPTDTLVRQPFARGMYELKMRNLVATARKDELTNADLRDMETVAREFALRQVRRTLFELSDSSNFTQSIRFLAPFWGAQEEAMVKWGRIAIERPETVARFYVGQSVMYQNFMVVDENNEEVKSPDGDFHYNPNHRVIIQVPKQLKNLPFFKKALDAFGSVGIPIGMMNTALQGDQPILPSFGPVVAAPSDWFLDNFRTDMGVGLSEDEYLGDLYKWIFPVGRPGEGAGRVMDQLLPGWARRIGQFMQGEDNRTYANTFNLVSREMYLSHQRKGLPPPSPREVAQAVKDHYHLRVMASFAFPFPVEWRPKNQMFLDEFHKMSQLYGPQAFEKFVEKYGADYARFAASSSTSPVGVPSTLKGTEEWASTRDLFAKYGEHWGAAITSPDAWADEFSSEAYDAQFEFSLEPGSTQSVRETVSPNERIAAADQRLGWIEFRQFSSALDAELFARGLSSIQQTGAEDLALLKRQFTDDLGARNEAWLEDFRTYEDNADLKVRQLQQWVGDPRFDSRPDIQGVRQYLLIRDQAAQALDEWGAMGGSRSLQAEENTDLRNWFYVQVGQLVQANPAFGEFYNRYLTQDRLTRGSGA